MSENEEKNQDVSAEEAAEDLSLARLEYWKRRPLWARRTLAVSGIALLAFLLGFFIFIFDVHADPATRRTVFVGALVSAIVYLIVYMGPGRPPER